MKTLNALALFIVTSLAATMTPTSNALAAAVIHSGSVCHNYNKGEANDPDFYVDGTKNSSTSSRSVICPLTVTHTSGQTTGTVVVDFNTSTPFSCTLYSYSYSDTYLGSSTVTTGSGSSRYVYLGTVPANSLSNHSVLCTLPPNYAGKIVAIEAYF
jgi:hypothetical protein